MAEHKQALIEEIIIELHSRISLVESYPDKRRPYVELYDSILKALPYVSGKTEEIGFLSHRVRGMIGDMYMVDYYRRFGIITQAIVADMTNVDSPVSRVYMIKSSFGRKAGISGILEENTETKERKVIQKNLFYKD
jgi:hypothetical protein